jgi:hypothetical protein
LGRRGRIGAVLGASWAASGRWPSIRSHQCRETEPIRPIEDRWIDATLPAMSRQVAAMLQLQRFTGMRPGEVVKLRLCDLDRSRDVWVFSPRFHRKRWRGHVRQVAIGSAWCRSAGRCSTGNPRALVATMHLQRRLGERPRALGYLRMASIVFNPGNVGGPAPEPRCRNSPACSLEVRDTSIAACYILYQTSGWQWLRRSPSSYCRGDRNRRQVINKYERRLCACFE